MSIENIYQFGLFNIEFLFTIFFLLYFHVGYWVHDVNDFFELMFSIVSDPIPKMKRPRGRPRIRPLGIFHVQSRPSFHFHYLLWVFLSLTLIFNQFAYFQLTIFIRWGGDSLEYPKYGKIEQKRFKKVDFISFISFYISAI